MRFGRIFSGLFGLFAALAVVFATLSAQPGEAQSFRNYCHERAQNLSGYRGRSGDVLGGAVRGAIGGAIVSGILGGDSRDRRQAARTGAFLGGISNARRPNSRATRIYRLEFDACMRRNR